MVFNTSVHLKSGDFEQLHLFLKAPSSDHRQKVRLVQSNPQCTMTSERWSNLCKFEIPFDEFSANGAVDLDVTLNIMVPNPNPYRLSRGVTLSELDRIWAENPHVDDYLQPESLVETEDERLVKHTQTIVSDSMDFWHAVRAIANWINSHIIYVYDMRNQPYQGALNTLQSRRAICSDFVHLFLAMTRIALIPSRAIIGFRRQNERGTWAVHSWSEVYDPTFGWTPIDMSVQPVNIARLGHNYIRMTAGYDCGQTFYAFYTTPQDGTSADISIGQSVQIGRQTVVVPYDSEEST